MSRISLSTIKPPLASIKIKLCAAKTFNRLPPVIK